MNENIMFEALDGITDEELILAGLDTPRKQRRPAFCFPRRLAAAAAAVLIVFIVSATGAGAVGVSIVKPIISFKSGTMVLDYSFPHDSADYNWEYPKYGEIDEDTIRELKDFASEDRIITAIGGSVSCGGDTYELKCIYGRSSISEISALIDLKYMLGDDPIWIMAEHMTIPVGTKLTSAEFHFGGTVRKITKQICGVECTLVYAESENSLIAFTRYERYYIHGGVDMEILENLFASVVGADN